MFNEKAAAGLLRRKVKVKLEGALGLRHNRA